MTSDCGQKVLQYVTKGLFDYADNVTRKCAKEVWQKTVSSWDYTTLYTFIDNITGGLGYSKERPLDPLASTMAGAVIAWPEVISSESIVLEIGTGLGRTCYAAHYRTKPRLYLTIDNSVEMLAIALYGNPISEYSKCLWHKHVKILLGDATKLLKLLANSLATHIIHDGGPNPIRNIKLFSKDVFKELYRVLSPCGTISVFAGRARKARQIVYINLVETGFVDIHSVSLPNSPAQVYRARKPCR